MKGAINMTIEVKNVSKTYENGELVLKDINFKIEDGEFFIIVGPSGCGKSTLLRIIAGLTELNSGSIIINGQDVTDIAPKDRNLTMVFQNYALYPFLDVRENVAFGLKKKNIVQDEINKRVENALDLVGLTEYAHKKPKNLSGGQRQRVALARAIASEAKICLMDEPLSNLDAQLRTNMRVILKDIQQKLGLTVIYVTHDQIEAMTMADRIMVVNNHKIQQIGTPSEIYNNPQNAFVGSFLGSPQMNVLKALCGKNSINIGNSLKVTSPFKSNEDEVLVGIRPEHLKLTVSTDGNAIVKHTEYLGNQQIVRIMLDDGQELNVINEELTHIFKSGDMVKVELNGKVHYFTNEKMTID